jgi:hypothetical protein
LSDDRWWTRDEAAAYLGLRPKTLANMASMGTGPEYRRLSGGKRGGTVRYRRDWCDAWVENHGMIAIPKPATRRGRPPAIRG